MSISFRSIAVWVALLFFVREGMDGALRYYLASVNLTFLIYVPTALIVLFVLFCFFSEQKRKPYTISFVIVILIGLSGLIGYLNSGHLTQTLFALYVFFPFFFGLQTSDLVYNSPVFRRASIFLLFLFSFGVFLEMTLNLPWKGFSYEMAGVDIEASRDWRSFGIERLSGFARNSFSMASLCMAFLIVLYGKVKPSLYVLLFALGGAAIILSTTKGVILVLFVLILMFIVKGISSLFYHLSLKTILIFSFLIGVILPISTLWVSYAFNYENIFKRVLLLSFEMRLGIVWPDAMEAFESLADFFIGKGAGQIGVATMIYDNASYNPGDNFFLYTQIVFGIPFLLLLGFLLYRLFKMNGQDGYVNLLLMTMFIFTYGIFTNVMESGVLAYFLGSMMAIVFRNEKDDIYGVS